MPNKKSSMKWAQKTGYALTTNGKMMKKINKNKKYLHIHICMHIYTENNMSSSTSVHATTA